MRVVVLAAVLLLTIGLVCPRVAAAQVLAGDAPAPRTAPLRPAPRAPEPPHPPAGLGVGVAIGTVHANGLEDGQLVRLEYEALPVLAPRGTFGGVFGFAAGLEYWFAGHDDGFAVPITVQIGVRTPHVRAVFQYGFEALLIDDVRDDAGFGMYAPIGGARVALDVEGWQLGADGRVVRRWQLGADDHTQWQLAFTIGRTWETKLREPIR